MRFLFPRKVSSTQSSSIHPHHGTTSTVVQTADIMSEAMNLIHSSPRTAKGYLIAGRAYVKENKLQEAITIYSQGLICVPPSTHGYDRLERNASIVAQEMKRQVTDKIISLVFGHLSEAELVQCTMVCRSWRRFFVDWSSFQERIHTAFPQLNMNSFKTPEQHLAFGDDNNGQHAIPLSPASKRLLSTISLTSLRLENVSIPASLVTSLALEQIELANYTRLTQDDLVFCQDIPHVRIIVPSLNALPAFSPNISFRFRSLDIIVQNRTEKQIDKLVQLIRQSPDLVYFGLHTTTHTRRRRYFVDDTSRNGMAIALTGISQALGPLLDLSKAILEALYLDNVALIDDTPKLLPCLRILECANVSSTSPPCPLITKLIEASPHLASVAFRGSTNVTDKILDTLCQRQDTVTHLQITAHPRFSPAGLMQVTSQCLNLTSITLGFLHRDLIPIIRRCRALRSLTLILPPKMQGHHPQLDMTLVAQVRDIIARRDGCFTLVNDPYLVR
ncbi:hypothetical protein BX666DRAFT_1979916 [Dichotomocladium elegans]|nr:hypothetical protein BX666DRAFT_1979916 [Dichotomocladium elegans]